MHQRLKRQQHGVSLSGLLVWGFILIIVATFGMKMIPAYLEQNSIKKVFDAIVSDPKMQTANAREIRLSFNKRANIDNIKAIRAKDIEISKTKGKLSLVSDYSVKIPMVANISVVIDFHAASQ